MEAPEPDRASTGNIGGFDFGLNAFLTDHEGNAYHSRQFLKSELPAIAHLKPGATGRGPRRDPGRKPGGRELEQDQGSALGTIHTESQPKKLCVSPLPSTHAPLTQASVSPGPMPVSITWK